MISNRYLNVPLKVTADKIKIQKTVFYPEIPLSDSDIYAITTQGDRFDLLANQFYGDMGYWWVIASANPELKQNSIFIPPGTQIRIPINLNQVLASYAALNNL